MGIHNRGRDPNDAHLALNDVAAARSRLADHIGVPWWYGAGLGLAFGSALLAAGGTGPLAVAAVALCAVVLPLALFWTVRRSTGVHRERYLTTPGALLTPALVVVAAVGLLLRWGVGLHWGTVPSALAALVVVVVLEHRIDATARQGLR